MHDNDKIDAVYTWVSSEDTQWQMEFNQSIKQSPPNSSIHPCRFRDLGEIFYSLLSLEQFAPWINKIFIVKRNYQSPQIDGLSLATRNKLIFIDVATLKPPELSYDEFYPTFNSLAIESNLHRIPGLSEKFIYFNNDTFLGRPVSSEYFFSGDKVRLSANRPIRLGEGFRILLKKFFYTGYTRHLLNTYKIFNQEIASPKSVGFSILDSPKHQCSPLLVSGYQYLWDNAGIKNQLLINSSSKFRKDSNFHIGFLVSLTNLWRGKALTFKEKEDASIDLRFNFRKKLANLKISRPVRFCINDDPRNTNSAEIMQLVTEFMQDYFGTRQKW